MKRVVIVDDNEVIREGLELALNATQRFQTINSYHTCEKAIQNFRKDEPDLVLMDLELPGMNGITGIERIKAINSDINILVITVHENTELVFKALASGAVGYITKARNDFFTELVKAADEMLNGGAPMSSSIARMVVKSFQKNNNSPLSARETEVLLLLSKGKSYATIADELFIARATVRAHIRNIYEKLQVNRKNQAIEKAIVQKLI